MATAASKFTFEITYHPFELNPDTPVSGVGQREHLSEKFGGMEQYESITGRTTAVAAQDGLEMNFDRQLILPNTRKAHALIFAARSEGTQLAVTEAFFQAYFTDGIDLSQDSELINIAVKGGLSRQVAETAIQSDALLDSISVQEREMQKLGVRAVPFYIFNNEYGVSGAQPAHSFVEVFDQLAQASTSEGGQCDVAEGNC